jgi:hypothetical protein
MVSDTIIVNNIHISNANMGFKLPTPFLWRLPRGGSHHPPLSLSPCRSRFVPFAVLSSHCLPWSNGAIEGAGSPNSVCGRHYLHLLIGRPCLPGWRVLCKGIIQRRVVGFGRVRSSLLSSIVNSNNNDKGTEQQVQGRGMGQPSSLSDLLPHWTEDNQGNRVGGGQHDPPLGSHHRRGVGDLNPMMALLTWMPFTRTVCPLPWESVTSEHGVHSKKGAPKHSTPPFISS